jgi:RNA polymerase sigma factor (TIGR02999 family)
MSELTRILSAIDAGDPHAAGQLLPLVYDELRRLAAGYLANEAAGHTLDGTALVHEAYLRLVASRGCERAEDAPSFANARHFFAAAAEAMRRILVDHARRKRALKRGGPAVAAHVDLNLLAAPTDDNDCWIDLDEALTAFSQIDAAAAELAKLQFVLQNACLVRLKPALTDTKDAIGHCSSISAYFCTDFAATIDEAPVAHIARQERFTVALEY